MAFPVFAKTWQFNVNSTLAAGSSATVNAQQFINKIVKALQAFSTNPWVVVSSCNAGIVGGSITYGTTGSTDLWTIDGVFLNGSGGVITVPCDVNYAAAGTRHSWIVLKQTGIAANFQICIDLNSNTPGTGSLIVSPSVGFTGGTVTNRPTASDEIVVQAGVVIGGQANVQHQFHLWQSSDGACTRIMVWRGGTNCELFWLFDKAQNPVAGWSNPFMVVASSSAGIANSFANIAAAGAVKMYGNGGTPAFSGCFTWEGYNAATPLVTATGIGTSVNTFDGQWPVMPMGVAANGVGNSGRLGNVFDLWWAPSAISDGDTFPNDPAARSYAKLGGMVLPWLGNSTVPLTS